MLGKAEPVIPISQVCTLRAREQERPVQGDSGRQGQKPALTLELDPHAGLPTKSIYVLDEQTGNPLIQEPKGTSGFPLPTSCPTLTPHHPGVRITEGHWICLPGLEEGLT